MRNYFSPFLLTLLLLGATGSAAIAQEPVSYTHLTLPTIYSV